MTAAVAEGGLGWDAAKAGPIYGLYTAHGLPDRAPRRLDRRPPPRPAAQRAGGGHHHRPRAPQPDLPQPRLLLPGAGPDRHRHRPAQAQHQHHGRRPLHAPRTRGATPASRSSTWGSTSAPSSRRWSVGFLAQSVQFRGFLASHGINPANSWHWGFGAAAVGMTARPRPVRPRRPPPGHRRAAAGASPIRRPAAKDRRNLLIGAVHPRGPDRASRSLLQLSMSDVTTLRRLRAAGHPDRLLRLPVQPAVDARGAQAPAGRSWRSSSSPPSSGPPSSRRARRSTCSPSASPATRSSASSIRRAGCSR